MTWQLDSQIKLRHVSGIRMTIKVILLHEHLPRKKAENYIVTGGKTRVARAITDTKFRGGKNRIFFGDILFPERQIQFTNVKRTVFTRH